MSRPVYMIEYLIHLFDTRKKKKKNLHHHVTLDKTVQVTFNIFVLTSVEDTAKYKDFKSTCGTDLGHSWLITEGLEK